MLRFPALGEKLDGVWNFKLMNEFHMTNDREAHFKNEPGPGRLPLWEGKQLHQFNANFGSPRYWVDEVKASEALRAPRMRSLLRQFKALGYPSAPDPARILLNHTSYRIAFRDITRTTDERTMIATVLPPGRFCPHTVSLEQVYTDEIRGETNISVSGLDAMSRLYLTAALNSLVFDWFIRQNVTTHVSFFIVYATPVPRPKPAEKLFVAVASRCAKLTCVSSEFDELAGTVGIESYCAGATDPAERARLRAEIDGLVAHLYGLNEAEFSHILATFPLVPEPAKVAALNALRDVEKGLIT